MRKPTGRTVKMCLLQGMQDAERASSSGRSKRAEVSQKRPTGMPLKMCSIVTPNIYEEPPGIPGGSSHLASDIQCLILYIDLVLLGMEPEETVRQTVDAFKGVCILIQGREYLHDPCILELLLLGFSIIVMFDVIIHECCFI